MKEGARVVITNPDSSFYKMSGTVVGNVSKAEDKKASPFVAIFITEKKKIYYFTEYDYRVVEK